MAEVVKSGNDVIREFFDEILDIQGVHEPTVKTLISLYKNGKFKETPIQNALDELMRNEMKKIEENDE